MTKYPFINALIAVAYISLVALVMFYVPKNIPDGSNILGPIAFISLFTLSAAMMGYIFLYQPLCLHQAGDTRGGVKLFLQTVGIFAAITIVVFMVLFSGVLPITPSVQ